MKMGQPPTHVSGGDLAAAARLLARARTDLPRLNLILGLMTLHANRTDRERDYTEIIRRNV
jgi:hypothetical protein